MLLYVAIRYYKDLRAGYGLLYGGKSQLIPIIHTQNMSLRAIL